MFPFESKWRSLLDDGLAEAADGVASSPESPRT